METKGSGGRMDVALAPMKQVKTTKPHNYISGDVVRLIGTGLNYLEGKRFRIDKIDNETFGIAEIGINQKVPDKQGNGAGVQKISGQVNLNIITTNPYRTSQALLFRGAVGNNSQYYNGKNFITPTKSTIVGGYPDSNDFGVGYKKDDIVKLVGGVVVVLVVQQSPPHSKSYL